MSKTDTNSSSVPPFLNLLVGLILLLTALSAVRLAELTYVREPLTEAHLWSVGPDRFGDFWHYRVLLEQLHSPSFFAARDRFAYPAPCALLFQALYQFGPHPHASFDLLLWAAEGVSALVLFRALRRSGMSLWRAGGLVTLLVATSYPWHFLYDRGNIEVVVYLFVAGGVWAWFAGQNRLAAVLWGFAGSFKIYPVVLLLLFARRGQFRTLVLGAIACCSALLLSFLYVGPTVRMAAMGTFSGVLGFIGHYGGHSRPAELVYDHSILGGIKEIFEFPGRDLSTPVAWVSRGYEVLVVVVGPFAYYRWQRTAPPLNRLCLLLLLLLLLPPVSYDYTLIYAYLVLGVVLCVAAERMQEGVRLAGARTYMVAFALLCTAQDWLFLHEMYPNGLIKCVALLAIAVTVVRFPLQKEHSEIAEQLGLAA